MKNKTNINLIKVNSFILYILPISLVTGPFIPNLIVTISSLIGLFLIIYNKQWNYFDNKFFKFFFIFSTYLILTSILNKNFSLNYVSGYTYLRYVIFSITLWHVLDCNNNFFKNFTKSVLLTISIIFIDAIFQYFNETNLLGIEKSSYNRISSFFGRDVKLGAYLARIYLFCFLFIYLFTKKGSLNIIYLNLINILFVIIILLTGERTSFLIFFLNIILINLIIKENFVKKIFILLIVLFTAIIIFKTTEDIKIRYIDSTIAQFKESNLNGYNVFSKTHENHYKIAIRMFNDSKVIGQGPNSFRSLCDNEKFRISSKNEGCSTHPHNIYVQLLGETGLIGFLFLLIAFIYVFFQVTSALIKANKNSINKKKFLFYVPLCIYLFPFIPTGNFFNSWVNIIVFLPLGFLLKEIYSKND